MFNLVNGFGLGVFLLVQICTKYGLINSPLVFAGLLVVSGACLIGGSKKLLGVVKSW